MPHTLAPISTHTALEDALGMLHTIMTARSTPNVERTEAAKALADLVLRIEDNILLRENDLQISVIRS